MKKILLICPYPTGLAPSQRFRIEQYLSHLEEKDFNTVIKPFFTEKAYHTLYQTGNKRSKIYAILQSYLRRLSLLLLANSYDFIFIHREATPVGPPFIEWWLVKVIKKKIVYDFDDAIWLTDKTGESRLEGSIRSRNKVKSICKWSYRISCGNNYLANYARQYNSNVAIVPTTIDTVQLHTAKRTSHANTSSKIKKGKVTIGWTGSHSTLKYLQIIVPVLKSLETKYPNVETLVIADRNPELPLQNFNFRSWSKESEISDLSEIDIGVMPLPDDEWTRGKCGFKALQYMALEIPAVVSPVGMNCEIIAHGEEGYLCNTLEDWYLFLEKLILDADLRRRMGNHARQKVIDYYSVEANVDKFCSLFQ